MDFSIWQIAIVLVIALLVFGPKRLPELGSSLGRGMREFKDSITGKDDEEDEKAERAKLEMSASQPQPEPGAEPVEGEVVENRT
ncbi:MAG: Sec-independent protein translocase subunit TatA/TatB [Solirubrobacterales bacterium]